MNKLTLGILTAVLTSSCMGNSRITYDLQVRRDGIYHGPAITNSEREWRYGIRTGYREPLDRSRDTGEMEVPLRGDTQYGSRTNHYKLLVTLLLDRQIFTHHWADDHWIECLAGVRMDIATTLDSSKYEVENEEVDAEIPQIDLDSAFGGSASVWYCLEPVCIGLEGNGNYDGDFAGVISTGVSF